MPVRSGRSRFSHQSFTPDGAGRDIFTARHQDVPVVSSPRLCPRSSVRAEACPLIPGRSACSRPKDHHQLDPRAGLSNQFRPCYTTVAAAGKKVYSSEFLGIVA